MHEREVASARSAPLPWRSLLAIVLVALVPRLLELREGLWRDEATTYYDVAVTSMPAFLRGLQSEQNPPLYFVIMYGWTHLAGYSQVALKLPGILFEIATIPLVFASARRAAAGTSGLLNSGNPESLRSSGTTSNSCAAATTSGLWAAGIFALSDAAVAYADDARPYALAGLASAFVLLTYLRLLERQTVRGIAAFAVSGAAVAYTHYSGVLYLGALAAASAIVLRPLPARRLVLAYGAAALAMAPVFVIAHQQLSLGTPWYVFPSAPGRALIFVQLMQANVPFGALFHPLLGDTLGGALGAAAVTLISVRSLLRRPLVALAGISALAGAAAQAAVGYNAPRYYFVYAPNLCVVYGAAAAWLVHALQTRWPDPSTRRRGAIALTAAAYAAFTVQTLVFHRGLAKSGLRALSAEVVPAGDRRRLWLVGPDYCAPTLGYYLRERNALVRGFARWDDPVHFRVDGYRNLWNAPDVVDTTLARVQHEVVSAHRNEIALVRCNFLHTAFIDSGALRYSLADRLAARLQQRYGTPRGADFPGIAENASVIIYHVHSSPR